MGMRRCCRFLIVQNKPYPGNNGIQTSGVAYDSHIAVGGNGYDGIFRELVIADIKTAENLFSASIGGIQNLILKLLLQIFRKNLFQI